MYYNISMSTFNIKVICSIKYIHGLFIYEIGGLLKWKDLRIIGTF